MIRLRGRRVFARAAPTDMRKGYSGLSSLVMHELGHDLVLGDVFLFMSRRRTTVKALVWDGTGLCILQKRLARGRFTPLWGRVSGGAVRLSHRELNGILEGLDLQLSISGMRVKTRQ